MAPRKALNLGQNDVDAQLSSIHLLDSTSVTENLEALGPIIKSITEARQLEAFLRVVEGLIEAKENEIQKICGDNYQDFVSSVSTLLTVRSYTVNLRERVTLLDQSVSAVGKSLTAKKKELLQTKRTAGNLDQAIDTLQSSLRILDIVKRVGDMIKEGRYWSALRSIEEIRSLPPSVLSQTPLYTHILSSLPSLRAQIKDAVTAANRTWLLEVRTVGGKVGKLALEQMRSRTRRWRSRREKEQFLRNNRVGSAVELVTHEKVEYNLLDNDQVEIDFSPLHQAIHIHTALNLLPSLQSTYHSDRQAQAQLILSSITSNHLPTVLPNLCCEFLGFFIVEMEVLRTTVGFRNRGQVEELWEEDVIKGLVELIENGIRYEKDMGVILEVKETLASFLQIMETYEFNITKLQTLMSSMFEKYSLLLQQQYSTAFEEAIAKDDHQPMIVTSAPQREIVFTTCWMRPGTASNLSRQGLPVTLPFSEMFFVCCTNIREYVEKYYHFIEGASHHYRNTDDELRTSLDTLLIEHVSKAVAARVPTLTTFQQAAQVITNVEHLLVACAELEIQLTNLRTSRRGGQIRLSSATHFEQTLQLASTRLSELIAKKLDDFFELAEYDFTPAISEDRPSMYLEELVHWLTTVVDSLPLEEAYLDQAYRSALKHVANNWMDLLFGKNIPMLNEYGISNILVDVDLLETEFKQMGKPHLISAFQELRLTTSLVLNNNVSQYLQPTARRSVYAPVQPKNLYALLDKMAKFGQGSRNAQEREAADRRRRDADAIARLF